MFPLLLQLRYPCQIFVGNAPSIWAHGQEVWVDFNWNSGGLLVKGLGGNPKFTAHLHLGVFSSYAFFCLLTAATPRKKWIFLWDFCGWCSSYLKTCTKSFKEFRWQLLCIRSSHRVCYPPISPIKMTPLPTLTHHHTYKSCIFHLELLWLMLRVSETVHKKFKRVTIRTLMVQHLWCGTYGAALMVPLRYTQAHLWKWGSF